jgi:hypothetical protein
MSSEWGHDSRSRPMTYKTYESTTTSIDTRTPKIFRLTFFKNPTPTRFKIPLESRQLSLQKCQIAFVVVPLVPLHDTTISNTPSAQHAPIECQQQRSNKHHIPKFSCAAEPPSFSLSPPQIAYSGTNWLPGPQKSTVVHPTYKLAKILQSFHGCHTY